LKTSVLSVCAMAIFACESPNTGDGGFGMPVVLGEDGGTPATPGASALTVTAFVFDPKVVVSADGAFHITHRTQTPGTIVYGRCVNQCSNNSSWQFVTLDSAPFVGASRLAVGPDLRVHIIYEVSSVFTYATCASDCALGGSWTQTVLALNPNCASEMQNANVVLDTAGRLSFMTSDFNESQLCLTTCLGNCTSGSSWQSGAVIAVQGNRASWAFAHHGTVLHVAYDDKVDGIRYRTCAGNCTQPENWLGTGLYFYHGTNAAIALAVAPSGRIHLTYNQGTAPMSAAAEVKASDDRLITWQCASNCGENLSWKGLSIGNLGEGVNGVSSQVTADGVVLLSAQGDLTLHACAAQCDAPSSWRSETFESATELLTGLPDPYSLGGCTTNGSPVPAQLATWAPEKPAFAVRPSGALLAHTMTRGLRTCPGVPSPTPFPGYGRLYWRE
jgi:hypothetical protein